MAMRWLSLTLAMALLSGPAAAQERTPEQVSTLVELARVMGESQALRQVCLGDDDRHWRTRLTSLIDNEQAEPELEKRLSGSFNAGMVAWRKIYPDCGPATRQAQADVADRGRKLSTRLAEAKRRVPGWQPSLPMDEQEVTAEPSPG